MTTPPFPALIIGQETDGKQSAPVLRSVTTPEGLPATGGKVLVRVHYSSLNYKDALAVTGRAKILRQFPIVPGIDLAGTVEDNGGDRRFEPGQEVVLTGAGSGEKFSGGYAGFARVSGDDLLPLPGFLTLRQAMAIGTAGFTAMQCVFTLESHGILPMPEDQIVVSGATGGVGSIAVIILASLGYKVVASTGRMATDGEWLQSLGADKVISREELAGDLDRPLDSARWAGGIDTVGGATLAGMLRQMREDGAVAACGMAGGTHLPVTVLPFILRGVSLLGINSVTCSRLLRETIWEELAENLDVEKLEALTRVIPLAEVPRWAEELLAGKIRGRLVVAVSADAT